MKKTISIFLLGIGAALLGGFVGAISAEFLHFVEWGQQLLWEVLTPGLPLQALFICTVGGLLVGLCQRYLGNHPKGIQEDASELIQTGRLDYRHLPNGIVTASVSLIFGASLGPEAAIMGLFGGLGTWVGDVICFLRKRLELRIESLSKKHMAKMLHNWPGWIALLVGAFLFVRLLNGLYSGGFLDLGDRPFRWVDLLWSVPLGLAGTISGWLYLTFQNRTRKLVAPLEPRPILRGTLG